MSYSEARNHFEKSRNNTADQRYHRKRTEQAVLTGLWF
jgi:hypothetical protein